MSRKPRFAKLGRPLCLVVLALMLLPVLLSATAPQMAANPGWWNSNWTRRKQVQTSTLDNDVFLSIDYDSDMQPDFDDLRFLEAEDSGELQYFIENYILGSKAYVWVERNSPADNVFWMYYGNSDATTTSLSWSGKIILGAKSIVSGWTKETSFEYKFPMGAQTYGSTGGSETHSHTYSGTTGGSGYRSGSGNVTNKDSGPHSHSISGTTTTDSSIPLYFGVIFVNRNNIPGVIDSDIVSLLSSLPGDWTEVGNENYYLRGDPTYGATGGRESLSHTASGTTSACTVKGEYQSYSGSDVMAAAGHTHSYSCSTDSVLPPYFSVIVASPSSQTTLPSGMLAFFNSLPPLGWGDISSTVGNRLFRISNVYGSTGGSDSHTHILSGSTGEESATVERLDGSQHSEANSACPHTHSISITTDPASSLPPYITTKVGKRLSSPSVVFGSEVSLNQLPVTSNIDVQGTQNIQHITDHTPDITWSYSDGDGDVQSHYQAQIWTGAGGKGTKKEDSGEVASASTTYTCTANNLVDGETYYARVRTKDGLGWGSYAQVQFRMNSKPSNPTSWTNLGMNLTDHTPAVTWSGQSDPEDTVTVYVYVGTTSTPTTEEGDSTTGTLDLGSTVPLSDGVTYYYRLRAYDGYEWNESYTTSDEFRMNTPPADPTSLTLNYPKVGETLTATGSGSNDAEGDGITYYYRFYDQTDGVERQAYSTTNTYTIVLADAHDTIRVFTKTHDGYEYSGEKYSDRVVTNTAPTSPTMTSNLGLHEIDHHPTVTWTKGTDADGDTINTYVCVGTSPSPTAEEGHNTGTSLMIGHTITLTDGQTYYVRLRSYDGYGYSSYTSDDTFRMNSEPTTTNLLCEGQTDPSEMTNPNPTFSWTYGDPEGDPQSHWEIEVGTTEGNNDMWDTGELSGSDGSDAYDGSELQASTTYYWRVKTKDGHEWSNWVTGQFTTLFAPTVATYPATDITTYGATLNGTLSSLSSYSPVDIFFEYRGAGEEYWIEASRITLVAPGDHVATVSGLAPNTAFEFRIAAEYDGYRTYGAIRTFITTRPMGLPLNEILALTIALAFAAGGFGLVRGRKMEAPLMMFVTGMFISSFAGLIELSIPIILTVALVLSISWKYARGT